MPTAEDIRLSLEDHLAELDDELANLTAALQALGEETATSGARRPRRSAAPRTRQRTAQPPAATPEPSPARPPRGRRQREELSGERVEAMLAESEGLSAVALARRLSATPSRVQTVLRDLEAAGRVRREGSRRTSRWRMITDEDRIADRAAQLAAQSRSAQTDE